MTDSAGTRDDGTGVETDWEHVKQSIGIILSTPVGSRVMRRTFGSRVHRLIDKPMTKRVIVDAVASIAEPLDRWEPRFLLQKVVVNDAGADGHLALDLYGLYIPDGHVSGRDPLRGRPRQFSLIVP